jgi:hypothetical protein
LLEPTETLLLPRCVLGEEDARRRLGEIDEGLIGFSHAYQETKGALKLIGRLIMDLSKEKHSIQMMLEELPKVIVTKKKAGLKVKFSDGELERIAKALGVGEEK